MMTRKKQRRLRRELAQHAHIFDQAEGFLAEHVVRVARVACFGPRPFSAGDGMVASAACAYVLHGAAVAEIERELMGTEEVFE